MTELSDQPHRCGLVALVGRPNVGKSTVLNHLLGQKLSITSRKPQTTRDRIMGVKTVAATQMIFVDTPGIHLDSSRAINRHMNKAATSAMREVDVVVWVLDKLRWTDEDALVLRQLEASSCPVIVAINKIDQLADKADLLPYIEQLKQRRSFADIVPVSALQGHNLAALESAIAQHMPVADWFFPEDQITDRSMRFLAAEMVREKVMRQLGEEVPYSVAVEIEEFKQEGSLTTISALILVEKDGQKAIVIGKQGERLKRIGQQARADMERMVDGKVMLNLWVKVRRGWADDERALRSLGYSDERPGE